MSQALECGLMLRVWACLVGWDGRMVGLELFERGRKVNERLFDVGKIVIWFCDLECCGRGNRMDVDVPETTGRRYNKCCACFPMQFTISPVLLSR